MGGTSNDVLASLERALLGITRPTVDFEQILAFDTDGDGQTDIPDPSVNLCSSSSERVVPNAFEIDQAVLELTLARLDLDAIPSNARRDQTQGAEYTAYVDSVQGLIDDLQNAAADDTNPITEEQAAVLIDAIVGTSFAPSVDIDALRDPALEGRINFVATLGAEFVQRPINFTDEEAIALVNAILTGDLGSRLVPSELGQFAFLSSEERNNIAAIVNLPTDGAIATGLDDTRTEAHIFATGDVDGRRADAGFAPTPSVDRFFLSPGLLGFDDKDSGATIAAGIRAFARAETAFAAEGDAGVGLFDSGVYVVNPAVISDQTVTALLHADFGLQGSGASQRSTVSTTIGQVRYESADDGSIEAIAGGNTIGSSRGLISTLDASGNPVANFGTVAFGGPLRSTSAGGGNPALREIGDPSAVRAGYAGYFVLENFDPAAPQDPSGLTINGDVPLVGGIEHAVGRSGDDAGYAYLRLATATGSEDLGSLSRASRQYQGYAAALGERETSSGVLVTQVDTGLDAANATLATSADENRLAMTLALSNGTSLRLGGLAVDDDATGTDTRGTSAFVDDERYAARTSGGVKDSVAALSGRLVTDGLPTDFGGGLIEQDYVQWGFFFGTYAVGEFAEHVHMGSWVAGELSDPAAVRDAIYPDTEVELTPTGSISYSGRAIGEVFNGESLYTASGTFDNTWSIGMRRGEVQMQFDGTAYSGVTEIQEGTASFIGTLNAADGGVMRGGGVVGSFVASPSDPIAGEIGRFSISEIAGEIEATEVYRASGTFAAERVGD